MVYIYRPVALVVPGARERVCLTEFGSEGSARARWFGGRERTDGREPSEGAKIQLGY